MSNSPSYNLIKKNKGGTDYGTYRRFERKDLKAGIKAKT